MVLALKTFLSSFWEPEGKSDSIKEKKNTMAFKTRAIYYKSKWPLIIRGNYFLYIKSWLKKLAGGWANKHLLPPPAGVWGVSHFRQFLGTGAHTQSTTLISPLPSVFHRPNLSTGSCINPYSLVLRKCLPVWAKRKRRE